MDIKINCHSSICVNGDIWFDPFKVEGGCAKYVFVTHSHWDHFSIEDIKKILINETKIICPVSMKSDIEDLFDCEIIYVEPEKSYQIDELVVDVVSSYNITKQFHPKVNGWVGYNVTIDGEKVMVVGDSDNTPELNQVKTDVLLVSIGGTYTMTLSEAAELANNIKPKKVIPTHYGEIVGDKDMGKEFKKLIDKNIVCEVLI